MDNLNNSQHAINHFDICEMKDSIDEFLAHANSIAALIYIGNFADVRELDQEIYSSFLNGISIINNSSKQLANKIKEYFNNEV